MRDRAAATRDAVGRTPTPTLPDWMRWLEVFVLMRRFAKALGVDPPDLQGHSADEALATYREFTAGCMEIAQEDERLVGMFRKSLGSEALALGRRVRTLALARGPRAFSLARLLYAGIGIGLAQTSSGALRFCPCMFAARYTPADCWFMSAFDEGFLRGLLNREDAQLMFSCRLTEGAPHCFARFCEQKETHERPAIPRLVI